jgi:hypothetical protein
MVGASGLCGVHGVTVRGVRCGEANALSATPVHGDVGPQYPSTPSGPYHRPEPATVARLAAMAWTGDRGE